jgi:hypothetical protein
MNIPVYVNKIVTVMCHRINEFHISLYPTGILLQKKIRVL